MTDLEDFFWDDLLDYMEEGKVIPIIGPGLVTIPVGETMVPLQRHMAKLVAESLKVRLGSDAENCTLDQVVSQFLHDRGRKEDIYPRIKRALKDKNFPVPSRLLDLARIPCFDLFVSISFDSLLVDAINQVRFGGNEKTEVISYSPSDVQDLPKEKKQLDRPVVYHMLGKLSASPDYAICDEDVLEFLHAMQSDSRRPHLLFDELKDNHLLLLGCHFPDWLSRFFMRMMKNQPLSLRRDQMEVMVDSDLDQDVTLISFLENFSYNTKMIPGSADAFVDELSRRWFERHPEGREPAAAAAAEPAAAGPAMEQGAIFLSYASDDVKRVERIKRALEAAGLDVWFDKGELQTGDDWDQKIRRNINNCSLFIPVVSSSTEERAEGYFRREWAWAADRALSFADEVPFIVPMTVDQTTAYTAKVPERFKRTQWAEVPEGEVTAELADKLKSLVRDFHRRQRAT